jgi:pyruvate dehydrogenase E2 component (dihydrolipoamide acetyltransferase)
MTQEVCMPKFGMSMLKGEIGEWLVKEGDVIEMGDNIVEIIENKATHTVPAMVSGTLEKIVVKQGESAKVGEVIALISE